MKLIQKNIFQSSKTRLGLALVCSAALIFAALTFAKEGELKIAAPSEAVSGSFPIQIRFHALAAHSDFHVRTMVDGRVVDARIAKAIQPGDLDRTWNFSSGINGGDSFDAALLSPGKHTISAVASTGTEFGKGTKIDSISKQITVRDTKSVAATEETTKIGIDQLPFSATTNPRSSASSSLIGLLKPLIGVETAEAASRHGDLDVIAEVAGTGERVPGVSVRIWHDPNIGGCGNGNSHGTDSNGAASFRDCVVSNQGGSDATYHVEVSNTPEGFMLADVAQKDVHIIWKQNRDIHFLYQRKAAEAPVSAPPAESTPPPQRTPLSQGADYTYKPDSKPFIAITKLSRAAVEVDTFALALNSSGNRIGMPISLDVFVDGAKKTTRQTESDNPTHHGISLDFGSDLVDQQGHTVTVVATSENGQSSRATIEILVGSRSNESIGNGAKTDDPGKFTGSLKVTAYANQFDGGTTKDKKLSRVEITTDNVGVTRQCPTPKRTTDSSGVAIFQNCPVAQKENDTHAKEYEVTAKIPSGFKVDPSFSGTDGIIVNGESVSRRVKLRNNQQSEVSFVFDATTSVSVVVVERVTDTEQPTINELLGPVDSRDYSILDNLPLGGVKVSIAPVGGSDVCAQASQETESDYEQDSYGSVVFSHCPVSYSGSVRQFDITVDPPQGFTANQNERTKRVAVSRSGRDPIILILDRTGD